MHASGLKWGMRLVITCAPNFPNGKIFDGYKNSWFTHEIVDGIQVIRVKTYIAANVGFVKRTLDFMSFMFMSALVGFFVKRPAVVVATSPQFFTAIAMVGCPCEAASICFVKGYLASFVVRGRYEAGKSGSISPTSHISNQPEHFSNHPSA